MYVQATEQGVKVMNHSWGGGSALWDQSAIGRTATEARNRIADLMSRSANMEFYTALADPRTYQLALRYLGEDACTGPHSAGEKLLLIPQHNVVLAMRGSIQLFLRVYELVLQASSAWTLRWSNSPPS